MLFKYQATDQQGVKNNGTIDAPSVDIAIASLQRRSLVIIEIHPADEGGFFAKEIAWLNRVKMRDIVMLSRQMATLFEAKVPVVNIFKLLGAESENQNLRIKMTAVTDDVQGGMSISGALAKHPDVFSNFYISMVRAGEESGKLSETFSYLADYLERQYALVSKAKNALMYPAFVVVSFIVIIILMMVVVVPQLATILEETGQELPLMTKIVIGMSNLVVNYGVFLLIIFIVCAFVLWRYGKSALGKNSFSRFKFSFPYLGNLYTKMYLSRIADNMDTMLESGIPMIKAIEVTADVVGDETYKNILLDAVNQVKGGSSFSGALEQYPEMPRIIIQMSKIGEETGKLGFVLKTMARFYKREVDSAVDTLVGLIEPVMIVALGLGVAFLLVAILGPIYNITAGL
ncbi:MAG: type II secretion system F family protein [Candidatus Vogelbacteria bacterium]|nr:type II secretion system F family protein [Candidatus Vogelbacteria bacterium]